MNTSKLYMKLRDRLLSDDNIFKAIYALDSYVFERGLLSENDINLLCQLRDCYNADLMQHTINDCRKKLEDILDNKQELFEIEVFFKFKSKEDDGSVKYRPLHSTSLENLICMVALLRPLMFDEQTDKIFLSGICKLIPHNFYGNLPSNKVETLFIPWKQQYKQYSERILQRYKTLSETKEYTQEVCLDLKDFFPSVSPYWIYQYVFDKLKNIWTASDDINCLKQVLCKLLFFKIKNKDMDVWESVYYPNIELKSQDIYYNRGIAQGLPQSYFFGNLAMVEIARLNAQTFTGDSYYYVDDSVIYTNGLNNEVFTKKIQDLNNGFSRFFEVPGNTIDEINSLLDDSIVSFQKRLKPSYKVQLHLTGKSFYSEIKETDGTHGGILPLMAKEVSIAGNLFDNMDEYDDRMSLSKINALLDIIDHYLKEYKKHPDDVNKKSQLKMLKRYRRFFLFRKKFIMLKTENVDYNDSGNVEKATQNLIDVLNNSEQKKQLLYEFDQEVFMTEALLLLNNCSQEMADKLIQSVLHLEKELASNSQRSHLYFYTSLIASQWIQKYRKQNNEYDSLGCIMRHAPAQMVSDSQKLEALFHLFTCDDTINAIYKIPVYAKKVCNCSEEFKRKILNTYLSEMFNVELSDTFNIFKRNSFHTLCYLELRVLAFVRNKTFQMKDFKSFMLSLCQKEQLLGYTGIDANLISILGLFVHKVRNPRHIDSLICTHQLVSGLWMNGSKFMHQYTLHNQDHAITLIRLSLKLIKHIDYLGLKQNDFFILFLSCYLHDVSMVINPQLKMFNKTPSESDAILIECILELQRIAVSERNRDLSAWKNMLLNIFGRVYDYFEESKRKVHAEESANFIVSHANNFFSYIEPAILQLVANIGESHGYDTIEVYGRKSDAKDKLFNVKCMMILIRLADVMDITSERVNYYLLKENFQHFSPISKFHWVSHHITDSVGILSQYTSCIEKNNVRIQETISIVMELNTNNLMPFNEKKFDCKGCDLTIEQDKSAGTKIMKYSIAPKNVSCTYSQSKEKRCPLLCVWIRKKHDYLFNELNELNRYINWVNMPLFKTNIEFVAKLAEKDKLDLEFFDAVLEYLDLQ